MIHHFTDFLRYISNIKNMTEDGRHIAILGAGIIGCTIAYYITLLKEDPNLEITIIEKTDIACAASGRAA